MLLSAQLGTLYVWRHMWVEFVVGSLLCSERIFSGYSGFPLSSKTNISKFQFDQDQVDKEPLCGSATSKSLLIYSFIYLFIYLYICYVFDLQPSDQTIHIPLVDLQIIDHRTRLSDNPRPSDPTLDQTTTDPRQTRPPNQITPPDHRPPVLTTRLPISPAYPTLWTGTGQVHSLWVGTRGVNRALDEPCKAYFPHTFGLKTSEFFFSALLNCS